MLVRVVSQYSRCTHASTIERPLSTVNAIRRRDHRRALKANCNVSAHSYKSGFCASCEFLSAAACDEVIEEHAGVSRMYVDTGSFADARTNVLAIAITSATVKSATI